MRRLTYDPPVDRRLAKDDAEMLDQGEVSVNTRLTLLHWAVLWMLVAAYATFLSFLLADG